MAGFARAGKDMLADVLIKEHGFTRLNFGSVIKDFFNEFTEYGAGPRFMADKVHSAASTGVSYDQVEGFTERVLIPYALTGQSISAYTEDDQLKPLIRPILEEGGDLIYDEVERRYFKRLDALLADGKSVVNTRLCRTREGKLWRERGGMIVEVNRLNHPPSTDWDRQVMEDLRDGGLITSTVHNSASSGAEYAASVPQIVRALLSA